MKKICICSTVSITMKSFIVPMAEYLHKKCGYDITLICNEDIKFRDSLPAYIHFIPVEMARGIDASGFKSVIKFVKIFKREKFDMVQYSTPNAACYASIAARICKVPIRRYCQWGIRYVGLQGIGRKIFKGIEKLICWNSTEIRAVSPMNLSFAVEEGLYKLNKAKVIGRGGTIGVDTAKFSLNCKEEWRQKIRDSYAIKNDDIVFGFAGRVSADKGCAELLSSFRKVSEYHSNAKLMVVGPLEDNCGIDISLVEWAKCSEQVVFTGLIENANMREYYAAMDVLVHPTYREGFGMVIQEAGALAVPVITTRIPGASEVMEDGVSCVLVEPKSENDLVKAMEALLQKQDIIEELGKNAYKMVIGYYDRMIMLENQSNDYIATLKEDVR